MTDEQVSSAIHRINDSVLSILVQWWLTDKLTAVIKEFQDKLLRQRMTTNRVSIYKSRATRWYTRVALQSTYLVDYILHVGDELRVDAAHDDDTERGDVTVKSSDAPREGIVEHEQRILVHPVPRRIIVPGLERIEARLNDIELYSAMLARDRAEFVLECSRHGLLSVGPDLAGMRIAFETAFVRFNVLYYKLLLLGLEPDELLQVDNSTA